MHGPSLTLRKPVRVKKTLGDLVSCKEERDRSKGQLDTCITQLDKLKSGEGGDAGPTEILVRYDGELLTITGKVRGGRPVAVTNTELTEVEQKVTETVTATIRASKEPIQKCYVQALKTHPDLESKAITIEIKVVVQPSGSLHSSPAPVMVPAPP